MGGQPRLLYESFPPFPPRTHTPRNANLLHTGSGPETDGKGKKGGREGRKESGEEKGEAPSEPLALCLPHPHPAATNGCSCRRCPPPLSCASSCTHRRFPFPLPEAPPKRKKER